MNSVLEFTERAANLYLRSAVFIDDEIYSEKWGKPLEGEIVARQRKRAFAARSDPPAQLPEAASTEAGEPAASFHPKDIVASFARRGIACALYEPPQEFSTDESSEVFKLCEVADLVILDWDLRKDEGAKMKELIAALVSQSCETLPHHSRLITIYTTAPSLRKVANVLFERLAKENPKPSDDTGLRLDVGATRIVVLGKTGGTRDETEKQFSLPEAELADRVFTEFVRKNRGILSGYSLFGMAAVKRNSQRILNKFSASMDGAFLLHRALTLHNEDAFEELPVLLADEFAAVVEDFCNQLGSMQEVVNDAVNSLSIVSPKQSWKSKTGEDIEFKPVAEDFLRQGITGLQKHPDCREVADLISGSRFRRSITANLMKTLTAAVQPLDEETNKKLAALFNTRTFYTAVTRPLTFGTIVRLADQNGGYDYSICLMPACDSLRLQPDKPISFPFCSLDAKGFRERKGRGMIGETATNQLIELIASATPRTLWIKKFAPSKDGFVAANAEKGSFWFTDDNGVKFEWTGQLKPMHAQRVAHDLGQAFTRIALTEAEWVRLLCDRA
jgi:hypothetical protein